MAKYTVIANINIERVFEAENEADAELQMADIELPHGYVEDSYELVKIIMENCRNCEIEIRPDITNPLALCDECYPL